MSIENDLNFISACLSIIGAIFLAKSLFVSNKQILEICLPRYCGDTDEDNLKNPLVQDRIKSRRDAMIGCGLLFVGFVCQAISIVWSARI